MNNVINRSLLVQLLAYNAEAGALGYCKALLTWTAAGSITADFDVIALGYKDYSAAALSYSGAAGRAMRVQLVIDCVLVVLVAAYLWLTSWNIWQVQC